MKSLDMGRQPIGNLLLKLAAPAVIGMLLQSIYMMIDGIFVGQGTGPLGLAAVNLSMPVLQVGTALAFMLVIGGITYTAIALGENNSAKANTTFNIVAKTLLISSLIFSLLGSIFSNQIASLTGAGPDTHAMVSGYISILSISMPFFMSTMLLESGMRITGKPMKSMMVLAFGALLNIGLDWIFIMKLGMGVNGAAIATGISQATSTLILIQDYLSDDFVLKLKNTPIQIDILKPVVFNGSSEFATGIALGVSTYLFNYILLNVKGSLAVSAYSIIVYISQIVFMIQYGIASGMQPLVSYNYGAKEDTRYKRALKLALITSSIIALIASILLLVFARPLSSIFVGNRPELIQMTVRASMFAALMYLPAGINILMSGYYTAVDQPIESATIALLRSLIFIAIGLFTLPQLFDLDGVWMTMPAAEILTTGACIIIMLIHINKENKPHASVNTPVNEAKKAMVL